MRRAIQVLLLALIAAGSVFWTFHEPFRADRLLRTLPPNATVVVHARGFAGIWEELAGHPLCSSVLVLAGQDPISLQELAENTEVRVWMNRLFAGGAAAAYAPAYGADGLPAWVVVSWAGADSVRLRLLLTVFGSRGIDRMPMHRGRNVWRVGPADGRSATLFFSVAEGFVVATISADPASILNALDALDCLAPSLATHAHPGAAAFADWAGDAPVHGHAWIPGRGLSGPVGFRLVRDTTGGLGADLRVPLAAAEPTPTVPRNPPDGLDGLLGDLPVALLCAPPQMMVELLQTAGDSSFLKILARLVKMNRGGDATLAVVGGEASGSLSGKRVPLVLLSVPLPNLQHGHASITNALAEVKSLAKVEFELEADPAFPGTLFALNEVGTMHFERFVREDRFAVAVEPGRLVFATNLKALRFLLQRSGTPASKFEASRARWLPVLSAQPHAGAAWADLRRMFRLMGEYYDLYTTVVTMQEAPNLEELILRAEEAREAWAYASLLREVRARVDTTDGKAAVIEIRAGVPRHAP